jgi:hypothetical protein
MVAMKITDKDRTVKYFFFGIEDDSVDGELVMLVPDSCYPVVGNLEGEFSDKYKHFNRFVHKR